MITIDLPAGSHCLVDINILLRLTQSPDDFPLQHAATQSLLARGNHLFMSFQSVAEFWNVSTRPRAQNGWGLPITEVSRNVTVLEQRFVVITEDRFTYKRWLALLAEHNVSGRQVHDARLVAHMLEHKIPYLLTSNVKDFTRYQQIRVLDPAYWS